jgi:hypothetical protein
LNGDVYNEPRFAKEIVGAGLITGLAGGLVLAVAMGIIGVVVGVAPADFARGISAVFRGADAMRTGAGDVVLGLLIHFVVASAFGVLFAWFIGRATKDSKALVGALVYGVVVWAIMTTIVVRAAAPQLMMLLERVPWWALLVAHLFHALPLAASPRLQRRIGQVPGERGEPEHDWVGRASKVPLQEKPATTSA